MRIRCQPAQVGPYAFRRKKKMKNTIKDIFIYAMLMVMSLLLVTATIKSMKPTEQDLLEERNRMTKTIQNNNEINVYSERELAVAQEIIESQNKEIVDIKTEQKLTNAPGRINQLMSKTYWKVTYKDK